MDDKYSFEAYWAPEREKLYKAHYRDWIIKTMEHAARKAWNHSKAMANEEVLEANVIVNRGIWEALHNNKRDNNEIQDSPKDKQ